MDKNHVSNRIDHYVEKMDSINARRVKLAQEQAEMAQLEVELCMRELEAFVQLKRDLGYIPDQEEKPNGAY